MGNVTSADVRQSYLGFFESKNHRIVPSASLVPVDDPTLLFTNAGMNQFKDIFLGLTVPQARRVTDSQKCMRVSGKHNDLEDVGPSPYHHTFFEMLGNWSFGDYYKREAISWAWEILTTVWGLPGDQLYATVFKDEKSEIPTDDEAAGYWQSETSVKDDHILYFGRKDNFWEMGETGPCGPCSEIHFDRGRPFCDLAHIDGHECQVNGDCNRFVELWNLVFIQYNAIAGGHLEPLPAQHVDTGLGFERLVMVLQGGKSTYDTDVFRQVFHRIQELTGQSDVEMRQNEVPYRVISDHGRAAAFLIGDGVLPGNIGQGYVLRMIIRRAARFGRKLGFSGPFLANVAESVIQLMGDHYRELRDRREHILRTITHEEERFLSTLDLGLNRLEQLLSQLPLGKTNLSGEDTFDLYATYGLPFEMTRDVAGEQGYSVDEDGFRKAMAHHRDLSGGGMLDGSRTELAIYAKMLEDLKVENRLLAEGVEHRPYSGTEVNGRVAALLLDGRRVEKVEPGDVVEVVLPVTPFYVEAGGQVSDTGVIMLTNREEREDLSVSTQCQQSIWQIQVTDVRRPLPQLIVHSGRVIRGRPGVGDWVCAQVDGERRKDVMRNHTATHLLHRGLRQIVGSHVQQAGSLVAPDRLRFDFTHHTELSQKEIGQINQSVNQMILANYPLSTSLEPYNQALENGVIALFGEKYGDVVRVVRIGEPGAFVSQELCGGTHVRETAEISQFRILTEGSVGAGVRRIEAVTGRSAQQLLSDRLGVLESAAALLDCLPEDVPSKLRALIDQSQRTKREADRLWTSLAQRDFEQLMLQATVLDGAAVLTARVDVPGVDTLRQMTDWFRDQHSSGVVVLGTVIDGRPLLIAAVTPDLTKRGLRADELIKKLAPIIGGGGGGRATLAQAGGRDAECLDEALSSVFELVKRALS